MSETVFAFDIGTGSLGIAVRKGNEIVEARSLLIPPEFASIGEQRERRRQFRTRLAHKEREKWLKDQCRIADIEVLQERIPENKKKGILPRKGDLRLEREFASPGDSTVYTSCLLRILLLQGEKLEGWQVYKALRSAIQRRGYDPEVPWKKKAKKSVEQDKEENENGDDSSKKEKSKTDKEERENLERIREYEKELRDITGGRKEFMYPCYHDAYRMGLWNPQTDTLKFRQTNEAKRARYDTSSLMNTGGAKGFAPRHLVEKELKTLLEAAAKLYPALIGKIDTIIYGPTGKAYASYRPELRKQYGIKLGAKTDWDGALAQKIPRFNNRCVNNCACITRFYVCRASDLLSIRVTFLMKLINMRYLDADSHEMQLTPEDINLIFDEKKKKEDSTNSPEDLAKLYSMNATDWKRWLKKIRKGKPVNKGEKVEPPDIKGRASFCRPALKLLQELIISGKSPHSFHDCEVAKISNTDKKKGLVPKDLVFLRLMPDDWKKIHIPAVPLVDRYCVEGGDIDDFVRKLIGKQNNPIIRHRLEFFWKQLGYLDILYGKPDRVIIEFVRGDFAGEKKKQELIKKQNQNRKKREEARKKMEEFNWPMTGKNLDKMILLLQQKYKCLFSDETLSCSDPEALEIEHVVPRGEGYEGPDSNLNTVVTTVKTNREKLKRTPYEFIRLGQGASQWEAYCRRVKEQKKTLGKLKVQILTAEHPEELLEKYTPLAETAWIARLAREIVCLWYGWTVTAEGEVQRVFVVKGSLTANARYRKGLNSILAKEGSSSEAKTKNRDDPRHHALDAMVLSFITPNKPLIPEIITRNDFKRWIVEKTTFEPVAFKKPILGETFYAKKKYKGEDIMSRRIPVSDWKTIKSNVQNILDENINKQIEEYLQKINDFLEKNPAPEKDRPKVEKSKWSDKFTMAILEFASTLHQSREKGGSRVLKVAVKAGNPLEYKDLSTDESGQYKRGKKEHWGQFICRDHNGKIHVLPVYAFQSIYKEKKRIINEGYIKPQFFRSGCKVVIDTDVSVGEKIIPAGEYILSTISEMNQQVRIENIETQPALSTLLKAGFRRVK